MRQITIPMNTLSLSISASFLDLTLFSVSEEWIHLIKYLILEVNFTMIRKQYL